MGPYLSVIIPAYNEEKRISTTVLDVDKKLSPAGFTYEIIVVDNNSKDHTKEMVDRLSHGLKTARAISCPIKGKGAAVKAGMLEAKGEYRMFMDADNSVSIDQALEVMKYFQEGYDIVIGSRDVGGAKNDQPWYRKLSGNFGNLIIQTLLLPGIWDTQTPMKIFKSEVAEKIFSPSRITRWGFDVEILSLAKKLGYKTKEVPVIFIHDAGSKIRAATYIDFLIEVLKVRWWLWFGGYKLK